MKEAILESKGELTDVAFVNCHATSTPAGDHSEMRAINSVLISYIENKIVIWQHKMSRYSTKILTWAHVRGSWSY